MRNGMMSVGILFVLIVIVAAPTEEQESGPRADLAKNFIGAWRLVAVEGHPAGRPDFYHRPPGILMFDSSGWMANQLTTKSSRKPWAGATVGTKRLNRTPEEVVAAFDSYAAYYGTYKVDTNTGTVSIRVQ